mgnify:FL=1
MQRALQSPLPFVGEVVRRVGEGGSSSSLGEAHHHPRPHPRQV